jgi:hypothetical protein
MKNRQHYQTINCEFGQGYNSCTTPQHPSSSSSETNIIYSSSETQTPSLESLSTVSAHATNLTSTELKNNNNRVTSNLNLNLNLKTIDVLTVYMLERLLEREFKEKFNIPNPKFEQDFIESIQNIIIYINLKLISYNDIAIEYGEIKKVNKTTIKDGVFVYDIEKYPISCKKFRRNSLSHKEKTNLKLKRILKNCY